MKTCLFILLFVFICTFLFSQEDINQRQTFIKAYKLSQSKQYNEALDLFKKINNIDKDNNLVNYLIGYCYYNMEDKDMRLKSIPYYEAAKDSVSEKCKIASYKEKHAPQCLYYQLGDMYSLNYEFEKAISMFEKFQICADAKERPDVEKKTKNAIFGKKIIKTPVKINIYNIGEVINSKYDDHSPVITEDENTLVFTSKRAGSTGKLKTTDGQYFEDIYISTKENGKWQEPKKISENINSMEHEASIAISSEGDELFIYKDDVGEGGNIYLSAKTEEGWSKPEKLGSNINTEFNESHASISPNGRILYFTSDRPGGYGGSDIYYVKRLPNGEWGLAQNLGEVVNTKYDEAGPFIQKDGTTFYFSSEGHSSIGGLDLFYSIFNDDGTISKPENLGYPINTVDDDVFYILSADGKRAYYSSEKEDTYGENDIYIMDLKSLPERSRVVLAGYVRDMNNNILKDVVLNIYDKKTDELIGKFKPNSETGKYTLVIPKSKNYKLAVEGSEITNTTLEVPQNSSFYYLKQAILIDTITKVKK